MPPSPGTPAPTRRPGGAADPRTLGRYELLGELASGGMATIYLGRARGIGGFERLVAIKCCHPHLRRDADFVAMFLDEARLAARIHHPNVVATLDVGEDDELFLVMEYIEGSQLSELIVSARSRGLRLPVEISVRLALDALEGLHAAHTLCDAEGRPLNIVHRDVSPQNLIVGVDGVTRILDFGIAKAEARLAVTRDGTVKGKLGYIAPEQLAMQPATSRGDVYALGVVLWESIAGRRLFCGESDAQVVQLVLAGEVPSLAEAVPGTPPALDAVLRRALEREPSRRYGSAAEFRDALERSGVPAAPPRAVADAVRDFASERLAQRRQILRGGGGAVLPRATPPRPERDVRTDFTRISPPSAGEDGTDEPLVRTPPPRGERRAPRLSLAAGALVLAAAGGLVSYRALSAVPTASDARPSTRGASTPRDASTPLTRAEAPAPSPPPALPTTATGTAPTPPADGAPGAAAPAATPRTASRRAARRSRATSHAPTGTSPAPGARPAARTPVRLNSL